MASSFTKGQYYWRFPDVESQFTSSGKPSHEIANKISQNIKPDSMAILYEFRPIFGTEKFDDGMPKPSELKLVTVNKGNLNGSFSKINKDDGDYEEIDYRGLKRSVEPSDDTDASILKTTLILNTEDHNKFFIALSDTDREMYYARINNSCLPGDTNEFTYNKYSSLVPSQKGGRSTRKKRVKRRKTHKRKNLHKKSRK